MHDTCSLRAATYQHFYVNCRKVKTKLHFLARITIAVTIIVRMKIVAKKIRLLVMIEVIEVVMMMATMAVAIMIRRAILVFQVY